jgi:hypothetical protein
MHDSDEYGVLRWELPEIAQAIGCTVKDLQELRRYGILKGAEKDSISQSYKETFTQRNAPAIEVELIREQLGPIWYSSRMVKDEYLRLKRAVHGSESLKHPNVPQPKGGYPKRDEDSEKDTSSIEEMEYDEEPISQATETSSYPSPTSSSSLTSSLSLTSSSTLKPRKSKTIAERSASADRSRPSWDAYEDGFYSRYGEKPLDNPKSRSQMLNFLKLVSVDEAPGIIASYLQNNHFRYVDSKHPLGLLVTDAQKLRTEWATKKPMTSASARRIDYSQTNLDAFAPLLAEEERKEREAEEERKNVH